MQIKNDFFSLSSALNDNLKPEEVLLCNFRGEQSDFVRLNNSLIRQAGSVCQYEVKLQLIKGKRHSSARCNISGQYENDLKQLQNLLSVLREQNQYIPEDPDLHYNTNPVNTDQNSTSQLPDSKQIIEQILNRANGLDLVGIYTSGALYHGFANSLGQYNWQTNHQFNLDWSCYLNADKAVKSQYAGSQWQASIFNKKFENIQHQLELLSTPPVSVNPGNYRCYLSPTALSSILEIAGWGGFGLKSHRTKNSPLIKLNEKATALDSRIRLSENNQCGYTPCFTEQGLIKPDEIVLIDQG